MNDKTNEIVIKKKWFERLDEYSGDFEYSHIPSAGRKSFITVLLVWLGFNINVSEIASGSLIFANLGFSTGIIAVAIGCAILGTVGCLVGVPCQKLGITYGSLTHYVWGSKGSIYASVMIALGEAVWISTMTSMIGYLLHMNFGWPIIPSIILSGIIFASTALVGFNAIALLSYFAVFAVFFGLFGSTAVVLSESASSVFAYKPSGSVDIWWGVTMVYATWAVGITHTGDIVRYCRKTSHVWYTTLLVFIFSEVFLMTLGGFLAMGTGQDDLVAALNASGLIITGTFVVFLATWTTADNCLYSASLPVSSISKVMGKPIAKWKAVAVLGLVFNILIAVLNLFQYYENFLGILAIVLPGFAGVTISDYWFIHKGRGKYLKTIDEIVTSEQSFNKAAFIAYIVSCFIAFYIDYLPHAEFPLIFNSSAVDALLSGMIVYWLISIATKTKRK